MKLLVIHWGSTGGGPRFASAMATAIDLSQDLEVRTSFNPSAAEFWRGDMTNSFPVRTYRSKTAMVTGLPRLLFTSLRLRRYIRRENFDVIYSPMFSIWQSLGSLVFLPARSTYASSIHDAVPHPGDEHWLISFCSRIDRRRADIIVCYSDSVAAAVRELLRTPTPVVVVPHGVDLDDSAEPKVLRQFDEANPLVLGFFGRLTRYKGIDLFAELIHELNRRRLPVRGVVRGAGQVETAVLSSSPPNIDWSNSWVAEAEVDPLVRSFDLLVLPYKEASQSGVLALAAGRGVPIIATPVGGLSEQLADTAGGIVAERVDAISLADAVEQTVKDPAVYSELSRSAIDRTRAKTSWRHAAKELELHFRQFLAQKG